MLPYYIIAVIVGMALLNALMFVILKKLGDRTEKLIRTSVLREISVYDHVLGRKLNEALASNEELKKQKKAAPPAAGWTDAAPRLDASALLNVQGGTYRSATFLRDYRRVKQLAMQDIPTLIDQVRRDADADGDSGLSPVAGILEKLTPEAMYELVTLPQKEQMLLLGELLTESEKGVLDAYMAGTEAFDVIAFWNEVQDGAQTGSDRLTVYTSDPAADYSFVGGEIETVYDPSICEGVRILYRDKLYDYCLLRREVL